MLIYKFNHMLNCTFYDMFFNFWDTVIYVIKAKYEISKIYGIKAKYKLLVIAVIISFIC